MSKISFLVLLSLLFCLTSCGSDDEEDSMNPNSAGTMTATINGSSWSANVSVGATRINTGGVDALTVIGSSTEVEGVSSTISLNLLGVTGTGTITVDGSSVTNLSSASFAVVYDNQGADSEVFNSIGNSGTVNITEFTETKVSGTFQFVGGATQDNTAGTRTITSGEFSVNL